MRLTCILVVAVCTFGLRATAQTDAQQLVRQVAANESRARGSGHTPWLYTFHRVDADKSEVREVVHTNDGPLYRVLSRNGQPLTAENQRKEDARIQELLHDPAKQQQEAHKFQHDLEEALKLMNILPEAFLFRIEGQEGELLRMSFEPNPQYRPGTRAARVAHAMRGTILVHPGQKRLAELKGIITNDVKFWGGILGTIRKGGTFQFRQTEVAPGQWVAKLIDVHMTGRVLLFHSINKQQHWTFSDFRRVPQDLSLARGAEMLREAPRAAMLDERR